MSSLGIDITVAITAHREGFLIGSAIRSAEKCIAEASLSGLSCDLIIVLDNADELTKRTAEAASISSTNMAIFNVSFADPALSRNFAAQACKGRYLAFLDGDDLWSSNWLLKAWDFYQKNSSNVVLHSEFNVVFGVQTLCWEHVDSMAPGFDPDYLSWANYWDAMSFSASSLFLEYPFPANQLAQGFGHEDWAWNHLTLMAGVAHRPVAGTIHFKRAREGSQMRLVEKNGNITWPFVQHDWRKRRALSP